MDKFIMPLKSDMQELVQHGSVQFPIQYFVNTIVPDGSDNVPLHWHTRPEFFTVKSGAVKARAGNAEITLKAGEGMFMNVNTLHSYIAVGEESAICPDIVFSEELLAPLNSAVNHLYVTPLLLNERLPYIHLTPAIDWQWEILDGLDEIFALLQRYGAVGIYGEPPHVEYRHGSVESGCFEMEVQRCMNRIWQLLFTHRRECEFTSGMKNEHILLIRMQKMLSFINENYSNDISLNDIAQSASISKSEASRCFQSYLNTSPVNYLLNFRVQKAMQLLRSTEMTVEAIALECRFGSAAYFCKLFRSRTGLTPKQYRRSRN
ncbi:MAG: AraC family transcriptional regulator [Oscillospiraceae bacterium]|nr:AraC family transcriptional regulator [Oscillospiraceae bacterium]